MKALFLICKSCYRSSFESNDDHVSLAFVTSFTDYTPSENITVLDLFKTNIQKVDWKNLDNLKILRLAKSQNLISVKFLNLHNLIALDLSHCKNLANIDMESTSNVKSLDLTFCSKLTKFNCDLHELEYLSIAMTGISELNFWPLLKYLDISKTKITDLSPITKFSKLQIIRMSKMSIKSIDLGPFTHLPYLASIECDIEHISFSECSSNTSLVSLFFSGSKSVSNLPQLRNFSVSTRDGLFGGRFEHPSPAGDWICSYRLLYGPFPYPPNDLKPIFEVKRVSIIPPSINPKIASNCIAGSVFGLALGDCLGLGTECYPKEYVNFLLENSLDITWTNMKSWDRHNELFRATFTDDTSLALTFLQSIVATDGVFKCHGLCCANQEMRFERNRGASRDSWDWIRQHNERGCEKAEL